jgi:hypothetical protein
MHPDIIRTMAEQQIDQWIAIAEADRRARQNRPGTGRRARQLLARRRAAAQHPAPHSA